MVSLNLPLLNRYLVSFQTKEPRYYFMHILFLLIRCRKNTTEIYRFQKPVVKRDEWIDDRELNVKKNGVIPLTAINFFKEGQYRL